MPKNKHKKKRIHLAKKEQAALEYLVTYGWAILVVLVAIAGLAYFGVFSSDKFIPSKCILPPGISCLDFKVENDRLTGNGKITLRVQNSLGEDISINNVAAAKCGTLTTSVPLANGEAITLYVDCTAPISTSKYNEQINITYASMFSGITHTLKGDLVSIVSGEIQQVNASPDITPPVLSNGAPTGTLAAGTTQATLSLTTNEAATCKYSASSGQSYASMTSTFTTTGATSHSTLITGLTNGTSYNYYARCQDTSNNANTNDYLISFSVANGTVADTTPPTVSITSPLNLATVSGTTTITATATDNIAVAGVQLRVDGANYGAEDTTAPYSISWDTTTAADGQHTLTATARDTSNNLATSSAIIVTVNNTAPDTTPPSTPTSLTATAVSSSQINLVWTASTDNVGVTGYSIYRCQDAGCMPTVQIANTSNTAYSDTGLIASTTYAYKVGAYDAAGNPSALSSTAQGTTQSTGSLWPNEPAGFTLVTDYGFSDNIPATSSTTQLGTSGWTTSNNLGPPPSSVGLTSRITDAAAPYSPSYVAEMTLPINMSGGGGGAAGPLDYNLAAGTREFYTAFYFLASNPFQGHSSGVNKILFLKFWDGTKQWIYKMQGQQTPYKSQITGEGLPQQPWQSQQGTFNLLPNGTGITLTLGVYHLVEIYSKGSTTPSSGDGIIRWWIDGVLDGNFTNINTPNQDMWNIHLTSLWGGTGNTKTEDDYYWFDHVHVSKAVPDTTPPTVTITLPTPNQVFASGTIQTTLSATTDEAATCKWDTTDQTYANMPSANTLSGAGSTSHSTTLTGLADGNSYTRYVRCQDTAGNANTASTFISFSVASSIPGLPQPGDIYEFGFEDGTFGTLVGASFRLPTQITVADPWVIDSTTAVRGTKSAKHHVKVTTHAIVSSTAANPTIVYSPGHNLNGTEYSAMISGHSNAGLNKWGDAVITYVDADHFSAAYVPSGYTGGTGGTLMYNQGYGLFAPSFASAPKYNPLYVRFAYMQSVGFDNSNPIKVARMNGGSTGYQNFGTLAHNVAGPNYFGINTDAGSGMGVSDSGNLAKSNWIAMGSPTPNDLRGAWHWFEFYQEQVDSTHNNYKLWLDDTLIMDFPNYATGSTIALGDYWNGAFIGDTLNSINADGYYWFDHIGISTQRMGVPP